MLSCSQNESLIFDPVTVALKESNLIEASAGTGKTYSITILVLRLLLKHILNSGEEQIFINQILMVTFTNAAVSELEERVRKFIKEAYDYTQSEKVENSNNPIHKVINNAVDQSDVQTVSDALKENILLLDESNISTIHGFCQTILSEFSFETNQLFGVEIFTEGPKAIENETNKFWRKYITTLDVDILETIGNLSELKKNIQQVVSSHIDGKEYWLYRDEEDYSLVNVNEWWRQELVKQAEKQKAFYIELKELFKNADIESWIAKSKARSYSKEPYLKVLNDFDGFLRIAEIDKSTVKNSFSEEFRNKLEYYQTNFQHLEQGLRSVLLTKIYCLAIQVITKSYHAFLSQINAVTYDELISKLHEAILGYRGDQLVLKLNQKYKSVFVDEFQDTDRMQYEIFDKAFGEESILFLIGDPKQSIYAWRKADMSTYFYAQSRVKHLYSMNVNYRSSEVAITAMNHFFRPTESFDTFYFGNSQPRIDYQYVLSPQENKKMSLFHLSSLCENGMTIYLEKKKENLAQKAAALVLELLTDSGFGIGTGENVRRIEPSDIGILVRSNREGAAIKQQLSQLRIPSILIDSTKVLGTNEAADMLYLLQAILQPSAGVINRVFLSSLMGYDYKRLASIPENTLLISFQELQSIWQQNGVYPAVIRFLTLFQIEKRLLKQRLGERRLTNIQQLIELLNQMEHRKKFSPEELVSWLQSGVEGQENIGDEYEIRMESDEQAVQIVTIHKSKGLEYNIVIAPFLDMTVSPKKGFNQFHEPDGNRYIIKEKELMIEEDLFTFNTEQEQENRRLIYVAITRAVSHVFIFHNNGMKGKNSSLATFLANPNKPYIEVFEDYSNEPSGFYRQEKTEKVSETLTADNFKLSGLDWHKLSFTGLTLHGDVTPKTRSSEFKDNYDQFVFDQLRFGAASGNLLHDILEKLDFRNIDNEEKITKLITDALKKYWSSNIDDTLLDNLKQLLTHIVNVPIQIGYHTIQLKNISFRKRVSEMEFDFPLDHFSYRDLLHIEKRFPIQVRFFDTEKIQGLMNGKIDLFFEYQGRFYILDWKSNYLGYELESYNRKGVEAAMQENNYHLQYLIYTVAVKKYLSRIILDFDYNKHFGGVIYLFLRGVRQEQTAGIFTTRPSLEQISYMEKVMGNNELVKV